MLTKSGAATAREGNFADSRRVSSRDSRREFLKASLSVPDSLALAELGSAAGQAAPAADIRVENVILIVSDTMRRDALFLHGSHWIPTPHIDRFAREAVIRHA